MNVLHVQKIRDWYLIPAQVTCLEHTHAKHPRRYKKPALCSWFRTLDCSYDLALLFTSTMNPAA